MITLEQAKVGMADKVDQNIIDEFRRESWLMDNLEFDDAVSPATGGSTLSYGYVRLKTPSTVSFRALNSEYTNSEAIREKLTAECKIFGGNFKLDRVIIGTSGAVDELAFQLDQKIKAAVNTFHYSVINGDEAVNPEQFDGLDTFLTGSSTEYNTGAALDISSAALRDENYNRFLDMMDEFVSGIYGDPTAFLVNTKTATLVKGIARRAGYFTQMEDAFGRSVGAWNDIPIVDMGNYYDASTNTTRPVVPIDTNGETSIYAPVLTREGGQMDGFHGISPTGGGILKTALPDLNAPGVLKEGDVEMVAAVVLKNTLRAGAFRKIKVR